MSSNIFNISNCLENLAKSKKIINESKSRENVDQFNLWLNKIEEEYQQYISSFSPAYVSGSSCYVGPSFKDWYLKNNTYSYNIINGLSAMSLINYTNKHFN